MSFCLNCSSHRPCQCAGPPPEVKDLRHPCETWFAKQLFEGNIDIQDDLRTLMTKAFNAGASYACREIRDVIPRGPLNDCCKDELQFSIEDIDAICAEWLD